MQPTRATTIVPGSTTTTDWRNVAACRGIPTALFFPQQGTTTDDQRAQVRAVCAGCPVHTPCLAEALANPDTKGIWAGTTDRDRKRMRRRRAGYQPFAHEHST